MASTYWVVSLPVQQNSSTTSLWSRLQESICRHSFETPLYRFNIPNLRVGTLDSLLALSDDLVKSNTFIEGVCSKTRRQIEELERVSGVLSSSLSLFAWDEAKYPTMSPLKEIVDGIHSQVAKIEDELKVHVSEYKNVRSQLNAINQKQTGSLAVLDLSNLVKPADVVTSEDLTTLLALTTYVVPRSSKMLYEDNEYAFYTVTLFNRDADNFKIKARERGFQIRDFEHNPETQESRKQELEKLMQDQETFRSFLLQCCYTSYGEVFSSWRHFCAVRIFAENILRYSLRPSFLSVVSAPSTKSEKKVRSILESLCDSSNSLTVTGPEYIYSILSLLEAESTDGGPLSESNFWKTEDE